ncbi:MAG: hypothetical protein RLZZ387_5742 [Chloroflexota bacterium]|jgi:hypothetical protein
MQAINTPDPLDDDFVAAALAAVALFLEAEQGAEEAAASPAWQVAGVVAAQGVAPARGAPRATWPTADRIARAGRWSAGLLGAFD